MEYFHNIALAYLLKNPLIKYLNNFILSKRTSKPQYNGKHCLLQLQSNNWEKVPIVTQEDLSQATIPVNKAVSLTCGKGQCVCVGWARKGNSKQLQRQTPPENKCHRCTFSLQTIRTGASGKLLIFRLPAQLGLAYLGLSTP